MNDLILIDNNTREYIVRDPKHFYNHLIACHTTNKTADQSVHEESSFYFTVTQEMFQKVEDFVLNYKTKLNQIYN